MVGGSSSIFRSRAGEHRLERGFPGVVIDLLRERDRQVDRVDSAALEVPCEVGADLGRLKARTVCIRAPDHLVRGARGKAGNGDEALGPLH